MQSPTDSACTSDTNGGTDSLPDITVAYSENSSSNLIQATAISTLATVMTDLDTVKACITDPSASTCTDTYASSTALPSVLEAKCSTTTCDLLTTCLTTPDDSTCTINSVSTSIPLKVLFTIVMTSSVAR